MEFLKKKHNVVVNDSECFWFDALVAENNFYVW